MKNNSIYCLAISPHPFDNEIGIAGTVARWTHEGKEVVYVICTDGEKGVANPKWLPEELGKVRVQEQAEAAKILGVKETIFLHHPDLDVEYTPEFRKELLKIVLEYRPEIVSVCDPFFRLKGYISNPDHRATGQAVLDTIWPYALTPNTFRDLYDAGYRPHNVKEVLLWGGDQPNTTYDISDTYDLKVKAFCCNKSQAGDPPRQQFIDRMLDRAVQSAKGHNFKLGEPFFRLEALQSL